MNSYPTVRGFTAIGTGGDDFVQAMVVAVESVLEQQIPEVSIFFFLYPFLFPRVCVGFLLGLKKLA